MRDTTGRAMATIIDSNLTTWIGTAILYQFGSGPIRGFAVTIGMGIWIGMFTAVSVTKLVVAKWLKWRPPAALQHFQYSRGAGNKIKAVAIHFIPHDTQIDFMSKRYWAYVTTAFMVIASIAAFLIKGLNYGIDLKGGLVMEVRSTAAPFDLVQQRSDLSGLVEGEVALQEFGSASDILIRIERQPGGDEEQIQALDKVKAYLGSDVEYRKVETVGPKISQDLLNNGLHAIFWSLLAIRRLW